MCPGDFWFKDLFDNCDLSCGKLNRFIFRLQFQNLPVFCQMDFLFPFSLIPLWNSGFLYHKFPLIFIRKFQLRTCVTLFFFLIAKKNCFFFIASCCFIPCISLKFRTFQLLSCNGILFSDMHSSVLFGDWIIFHRELQLYVLFHQINFLTPFSLIPLWVLCFLYSKFPLITVCDLQDLTFINLPLLIVYQCCSLFLILFLFLIPLINNKLRTFQ